jgi:hypothetical protein
MAYLKTVSLIESYTPELIDYIGPPVKSSGWYGPTSGVHTICIKVINFTGTIFIDGTLATKPTDQDWFPILVCGKAGLVFAKDFNTPPDGWITIGYYGTSKTLGFTFTCNCLYLRARMIRNYVISPYATAQQISTYGSIDTILVSY